MTEDILLTTSEVAARIGITVQAVYKAYQRGTLKQKKRVKNITYYSSVEVDRYIKENKGKVGYRKPESKK